MGRSSRAVAQSNRELIVQSACLLFRKRGVESVSIADIMAAAGLTPGGFYKHFESKEALIEEAFSLAFSQSLGSWQQLFATDDAGLTALAQRYFRQRAGERGCPILCFATQVSNSSLNAPSAAAYGDGARALFGEFCQQSVAADQSERDADSQEHAALLFAAMVGTGLLTRTLGETPWIRLMQTAVLNALPNSNLSESAL